MDELLDVLDLFADSEFEGLLTWVFRLFGILAVLAGIGIWLVTDITLLIPAVLIVAGLLLIVIPGVVLELTEIAG